MNSAVSAPANIEPEMFTNGSKCQAKESASTLHVPEIINLSPALMRMPPSSWVTPYSVIKGETMGRTEDTTYTGIEASAGSFPRFCTVTVNTYGIVRVAAKVPAGNTGIATGSICRRFPSESVQYSMTIPSSKMHCQEKVKLCTERSSESISKSLEPLASNVRLYPVETTISVPPSITARRGSTSTKTSALPDDEIVASS
mmetsp:Transcript_29380/g.60223  ORF Transcript_29380/g.60223 Transcript_29380/m.60223 type:complete len:200 (+) Transcript_29380:2729-3328(+)